MALEIAPFDAAKYLKTEADQIALLKDALSSGHAGYIAKAIGAVARAQGGLAALERKTRIKRQTLNKALRENSNPTLETVLPVMAALGLQLTVERASEQAEVREPVAA
jgi:probable addiction module antidote protein